MNIHRAMKNDIEPSADVTEEHGLLLFKARRFARKALGPAFDSRNARMLRESSPESRSRIPVAATAPSFIPPFFILGHPRSGTTLLREILNRHPLWCVPPENGAIKEMIRAFGASRTLPWEAAVKRVVAQFPAGYESQHWNIDIESVVDKALAVNGSERSLAAIFDLLYREYAVQQNSQSQRWGDKSTPGSFSYLNELAQVFPRAQYIHIVRDGRDSVASCVRAGFYDKSVVKAGYAWADNVRYCRELGKTLGLDQFYIISYEDLVTDTEGVVRRVCEFLGGEYSRELLQVDAVGSGVSADVAALAHHRNVLGPISAQSVGSWRKTLSQRSVYALEKIIGNELNRFGY